MPYMVMQHDVDPKEKLLQELGSLDGLEIFNNQVLVAVYIRPNRTKSGIYLSDQTTDEDKFQSKVGLVIKVGPTAFDDPEGKWFHGVTVNLHDWIVFRPSDGWAVTANKVVCRVINDTDVRGRVDQPDKVW
jgi:co-chaperonin GroES (HSP10)